MSGCVILRLFHVQRQNPAEPWALNLSEDSTGRGRKKKKTRENNVGVPTEATGELSKWRCKARSYSSSVTPALSPLFLEYTSGINNKAQLNKTWRVRRHACHFSRREKKKKNLQQRVTIFPDIPDGRRRNAALYRNSAWVDLAERTLNPAPTLKLDLFDWRSLTWAMVNKSAVIIGSSIRFSPPLVLFMVFCLVNSLQLWQRCALRYCFCSDFFSPRNTPLYVLL